MSAPEKLLLAVADPALQAVLKEGLEKAGKKVFVSSDGTHAILLADNDRFHAAIIEGKLPTMSGLQVAASMRLSAFNSKCALYVIVNQDDEEGKARAKQIGGITVFEKPVEARVIIEKLLGKEKSQPSAYDVRILNCFMEAVREVMEFYFGHPPDMGRPFIKTDRKARGYVSSLISLTSAKTAGSVSVTCGRPFLNILADKVFQGQNTVLDDTGIADLTGEMCNQITGKVKLNLAQIGMAVKIGLPKVVIGVDHVVVHSANTPIITIPISVEGHDCAIEFCLTEGAEGEIDEDKAEAPPPDMILF